MLQQEFVNIKLVDVSGRVVAILEQGNRYNEGRHKRSFQIEHSISEGRYFVVLENEEGVLGIEQVIVAKGT